MSIAIRKFNIVKLYLSKSIFHDIIINKILTYYWNIIENKSKILSNWVNQTRLTSLIYKNKHILNFIKNNNPTNIDWNILCMNPNAIDLFKNNEDKINWAILSKNPNAIDILEKNKHMILWDQFSYNLNGLKLIKERIKYESNLTVNEYIKLNNKINWAAICKSSNPEIINLIKERIIYEKKFKEKDYDLLNYNEIINWSIICRNPITINILKENVNKIDWSELSKNTNAIEILKNNINNINWVNLSNNKNAIDLLKNNLYKIDWSRLSSNPNAIELIKDRINFEKYNPDIYDKSNCIDWDELSLNPNSIEILKENKNKINWFKLCLNNNIEKTIDLIKERALYELELNNNFTKLNWNLLSSNPLIFEEEPMPKI